MIDARKVGLFDSPILNRAELEKPKQGFGEVAC